MGSSFEKVLKSNGLVLKMKIHSGKFKIFDKDLEHATQVDLHDKEDFSDKGHGQL